MTEDAFRQEPRSRVEFSMSNAPFQRLRRAALALIVLLPILLTLAGMLVRTDSGATQRLGWSRILLFSAGAALWGLGTLGPILVRPRPNLAGTEGAKLVRFAPWRRLLLASMPWPLLVLDLVVPGDSWKLGLPLSIGTMALFWAALGQRLYVDGDGIRMSGPLEKGARVAWRDITAVSVQAPRVLVRGASGAWLGVNALAMDGSAEFISEVLARCPRVVGSNREELQAIVAWANGQEGGSPAE